MQNGNSSVTRPLLAPPTFWLSHAHTHTHNHTHTSKVEADNDYTLAANLCALSPYYLLLFMPFPLFTSYFFCFIYIILLLVLLLLTRHCVRMQKWTRTTPYTVSNRSLVWPVA